MFTKLNAARTRAAGQDGFTLIELLVVILIIGILAAIALPKFLGPRDSAQDSQAKSAVRNAVTAAESFYSGGQTYAGFGAELANVEPSLTVVADGTALAASTDAKNVLVTASASAVEICSKSKSGRFFCADLTPSAAGTFGKSATKTDALSVAQAATAGW